MPAPDYQRLFPTPPVFMEAVLYGGKLLLAPVGTPRDVALLDQALTSYDPTQWVDAGGIPPMVQHLWQPE